MDSPNSGTGGAQLARRFAPWSFLQQLVYDTEHAIVMKTNAGEEIDSLVNLLYTYVAPVARSSDPDFAADWSKMKERRQDDGDVSHEERLEQHELLVASAIRTGLLAPPPMAIEDATDVFGLPETAEPEEARA